MAFAAAAAASVGAARTARRVCGGRAPSRWRACAAAAGGAAGGAAPITRSTVEKTVRLAQLDLSGDEIDRLTPEFAKIVGFIDALAALDVDGVEPMSRVEDSVNVLREDVPAPFADVDAIMGQVPLREGDFVRVPKIGAEPA